MIAAFVYLNTIPAGFTFDDNFAVVSIRSRMVGLNSWLLNTIRHGGAAAKPTRCFDALLPPPAPPRLGGPLTPSFLITRRQISNGDGTNNATPLHTLLEHDFWCVARRQTAAAHAYHPAHRPTKHSSTVQTRLPNATPTPAHTTPQGSEHPQQHLPQVLPPPHRPRLPPDAASLVPVDKSGARARSAAGAGRAQ